MQNEDTHSNINRQRNQISELAHDELSQLLRPSNHLTDNELDRLIQTPTPNPIRTDEYYPNAPTLADTLLNFVALRCHAHNNPDLQNSLRYQIFDFAYLTERTIDRIINMAKDGGLRHPIDREALYQQLNLVQQTLML